MNLKGKRWLLLGGLCSFAIALLHLVMIFVGAPAYRYFGAGEDMAQRAASGSVQPALTTLFIVGVFSLWGLYAFSGAGIIRRLPLLRIGLAVITAIYTLRGLAAIIQLILMVSSPESVLFRNLVFSLLSLFIGIVYLIGIVAMWREHAGK
jgi:hypothetical protein